MHIITIDIISISFTDVDRSGRRRLVHMCAQDVYRQHRGIYGRMGITLDLDYEFGIHERETRELCLVKVHDEELISWCQSSWLFCELGVKVGNISWPTLKISKNKN